ncbi:MAG: hypothetical protein J6D23_06655 [Clostridia bacterium]|nr:hypothetical protein [Clostridia bacterium]
METKKNVLISINHKASDYLSLNLKAVAGMDAWQKAIEIFDDRINGRFISQVRLLKQNVKDNGFSMTAIICLLIETLAQFENGLDNSPRSGEICKNFLIKHFPQHFDNDTSTLFYKKIRCGILHQAQTQNGSRISVVESRKIVEIKNNVFTVYINALFNKLEEYYNEYKTKLANPLELQLRENFIKKMNYICKRTS